MGEDFLGTGVLPLQLSGPMEIKSADQRILATSNEAGARKK
jgi:hypothetical protein